MKCDKCSEYWKMGYTKYKFRCYNFTAACTNRKTNTQLETDFHQYIELFGWVFGIIWQQMLPHVYGIANVFKEKVIRLQKYPANCKHTQENWMFVKIKSMCMKLFL